MKSSILGNVLGKVLRISTFVIVLAGCKKDDGSGFGPVTPPPVQVTPSVSVTATPATVTYGGTSTVNWTTSNAPNVTSSIGVNTTNGSVTMTNLVKDTVVTVTATSSTNVTVTKEQKITVTLPSKIIALTAKPWKKKSAVAFTGVSWHDVFNPCEADDIFNFFITGKGTQAQGSDKCNPGIPDLLDFVWAANVDANGVITITKWSFNVWTIEICDDNVLQLYSKEGNNEARMTFTH